MGKSTQPFRKRHSGHKQEIKNQIGGLGQHYGGTRGCGYENLKIIIIEKVENGNGELLGKREIYWQNQLRCFMENGGQAHCKRKEKWKYLAFGSNTISLKYRRINFKSRSFAQYHSWKWYVNPIKTSPMKALWISNKLFEIYSKHLL